MIKPVRSVLLVVWLMVLLGAMGGASAVSAEGGPHLEACALSSQGCSLTYHWHTFYGVPDSVGEPTSVAVDTAGNVYIAGYSDTSWGSPLHAHSGDYDIMVIKLNSQGQYLWHTYYGASPTPGEDGDDEAAAIAVDSSGHVYITGYSDRTWQGPHDADPLHSHGGDAEYMFVLKLDRHGVYQWHTFYQPGRAQAIALDNANAYITGYADGSWGRPQHTSGGRLVILKLNSSGAYQWHTYYGAGASAADEVAYGIAADRARNALYVTGQSPDNWLGDGNTPPLHPFSGGEGYSSDIVTLKLDSNGNYQWHTFYGSDGYDEVGHGVAVDGNGNPYITGESFESWGSPLHAFSGERDIAVLKLNSSGAHQWHTFYGSTANDNGAGVAVGEGGNVYISGESAQPWLGPDNAEPAHPHSGGLYDIMVLKLDANGRYQRHTFYGADESYDYGHDLALDDDHGVFITGPSTTTWRGAGGATPLHPHSGNLEGDGFVLKLSDRVFSLYLPVILR